MREDTRPLDPEKRPGFDSIESNDEAASTNPNPPGQLIRLAGYIMPR